MSMPQSQDRLTVILTPAAAEAGLVIDGVTITSAGRRRLVRVDVDLPADAIGSVDLDSVAVASRAISAALDESPETAEVIGAGPYSLEVGTAGVGRPLRQRRHWMRARTRLVQVTTTGGTTVTGRVQQVDDAGVRLDIGGKVRVLGWSEVRGGEVQVEFRRVDPGAGAGEAKPADDEDLGDQDEDLGDGEADDEDLGDQDEDLGDGEADDEDRGDEDRGDEDPGDDRTHETRG